MTQPVAFAAQLLPTQMQDAKDQGFVSVINNRPDGEETGQPLSAEIEKVAKELGLNYAYIPVISGQMTQENIDDFAQAYNQIAKPVLIFCRSGSRSKVLYEAAQGMNLLNES